MAAGVPPGRSLCVRDESTQIALQVTTRSGLAQRVQRQVRRRQWLRARPPRYADLRWRLVCTRNPV